MSKKFMLGVLAVFVLLSLLAMAVAGKSRFPLVNSVVAAVVLPAESGLNSIGNAGNSLRGYWKALTVMQSENAQLKEDNSQLRNANIRMASIYAENLQLRALLDYKEQHQSQTVVAAKVISRNYGDLRDCMYIDAGADKGLRREMAVVNGGLVGVVDEVYDDYARVLLLNSPRFKVGARVLRAGSRAVGVIGGKTAFGDTLVLEHIFREADIRQGDIIVTSGYSGSHPADILIGTVTATRMDSVGLLQEAEVHAAADIADVEHVLVITAFTPVKKIEFDKQGGQAQ
ncbi:MAG: rod shape-determining protein MreC [Phascolarctobacterium sp.]|uniref:rod shape-determining protein MreC n=1 Tax=Phascolarctobacterium sp. TaxID=2049039 RepID=UPI0026DC6D6D|nr:rod shape-determining protein MreC [Phascolarctobacterium sp.]MDO4922365.1 rod shape-determining protein MreC [Phascolarctobacterium sp.]